MAKSNFFKSERFYSIAEIAEAIGVTRCALYTWRRQGKFPEGVLLGDMRRFTGGELNEWLATQYADKGRQSMKGAARWRNRPVSKAAEV